MKTVLERLSLARLQTAIRPFIVALYLFWFGTALAQTGPKVVFAPPGGNAPAAENTIVLPAPIPDPIEGVNRRLWAVNKAAMIGVVKPTAKVYRAIVFTPLRIGISNVGHNLLYPRRLVNNLLQARWEGAGDETSRFVCNSVLGIGGLFDVATRWKIPASDADLGQTFGVWGWNPNVYLMLPIMGPSNERDAVGAAGDTAMNPLTYFSPYSYITYGITYNNLADDVDAYVRSAKTEEDPYYVLHYASSILRARHRPVDLRLKGEQDPSSLETLGVAFVTFRNASFPESGATRAALIPETGRELPYRYWLQPKKAPVVYIVPGVGSHRLNSTSLALAETLYEHGFSVVSISSAFNYEFMERAASTALPGYPPVDAHDTHVALTRIDQDLQSAHPERLGTRALLGYSMGGFHTLLIAATAATNRDLIQFDRYVAIDAPPRLLHAITIVDDFFRAPLAWPSAERTANIENTFLKVAVLAKQHPAPDANPPLNAIESRFLVGLAFKLTLRDMIFVSQLRHNLGVLKEPLNRWKRDPVYHEILQYNYADYLDDFLMPYYKTRGIDLSDAQLLNNDVNLLSRAEMLKDNKRIRLIENRDDILLEPSDIEWLEKVFPPERLKFFERGGHLGNLGYPAVQAAIIDALQGLGTARDQTVSRNGS